MFASRTVIPSLLLLLASTADAFVSPSVGQKCPSTFVTKQPTLLFLSDVSTTTTIEETAADAVVVS
jgi:hypothetical protein